MEELVPVATPDGQQRFQSISHAATLAQLVNAVLQDPSLESVWGGLTSSAPDTRHWGVQRILRSAPGREWSALELDSLADRLLSPDCTVSEALIPDDAPPRQFSDFALTKHLHAPLLRLVHLPSAVTVVFRDVPGIPNDSRCTFFLATCMTTALVIDAVVEELGIKQSVVYGSTSTPVEYVLQLDNGDPIPLAVPVLSHLNTLQLDSPYSLVLTVSPEWYAQIGGGAGRAKREEDTTVGSWRPASIFGGIWSGTEASDNQAVKIGTQRKAPTASKNRLSTLFSEWVVPDALESKARLVSQPLPMDDTNLVPARFLTLTSSQRAQVVGLGIEETEEDLDSAFDSLMVDRGIKGSQRDAMLALDPDRKRFLLAQHRQSEPPPSLHQRRAAPASAAEGTLASLKRMSLVGVGWAVGSAEEPEPKSISPSRTSIDRKTSMTASSPLQDVLSPPVPRSPNFASPVEGSSSWTSWWSTASNATGIGHSVGESKDGPAFYVEQLSSAKISQRSLVKHLIALRVRLSTSKLSWTQEFLAGAGLEALESLLGKIATKRVSREREVQTDEDETVQTECVKCLRVVMNTEVGFEQVIAQDSLITYIAYSLHTSSNKLRAQVADVLAALCIISLTDGHRVVLAALSDFSVAHGERFRFEYLVESISVADVGEEDTIQDAGTWEYRTAALSLINALVNSPPDLEVRIMLRDEFGRRGLHEVMTALRYVSPPDFLLTQLDLYIGERQEDQDELRSLTVTDAEATTFDSSTRALIDLVQRNESLRPLLVDTARLLVSIEERDIDPALHSRLTAVLQSFLEHFVRLRDVDGWDSFMAEYLASVSHIVGAWTMVAERAESAGGRSLQWTAMMDELALKKIEVTELGTTVELGQKEIKYLKRALESVYARSSQSRARSTPSPPATELDAQAVVTRTLAAVETKDDELRLLKEEVLKLKTLAANQRRIPTFGRNAPPPPAPPSTEAPSTESQFKQRTTPPPPPAPVRKVSTRASPASLAPLDTVSEGDAGSRIASPQPTTPVVPLAPPPPPFARGSPPAVPGPTTPVPTAPLTSTPRATPVIPLAPPPPPYVPGPRVASPSQAPPPRPSFLASIAQVRPPSPSSSPIAPPATALVHPPLPFLSQVAQPASARPPLPFLASLGQLKSTTPSSPPSSPPAPSSRPQLPFLAQVSGPSAAPRLPFLNAISQTQSLASASSSRTRPAVPTSNSIPPPAPAPARAIARPPQQKMKPFFWNKITAPASSVASVWSEIDTVAPLDLPDIEASFAITVAAKPVVDTSTVAPKKNGTTLLGLGRANNISIMLARFRFPHAQIRDALLQLDDGKLSIDNLIAIKQYVPTTDEIESIRGFEGEVATLASSDQYFHEILVIPRLSERLGCMLYRRKLEMDMEELKPDLSILRCAADEMKSSRMLKKLLSTVLAIGNRLNAATFRGDADGFQLESLLKLKDTRAANATPGTPTLLHYLVRVILRSDPALLNFLDEASHVAAASRTSFSTIMGAVHSLVNGLSAIKEEIRVLKKMRISPVGDEFVSMMESFVQHASPAIVALETMGSKLEVDLRALVQYYGEDFNATKPEDLFGIVVAFSSALQRAELEVRAADKKLGITPRASTSLGATLEVPEPLGRKSLGRGGLDDALRDLRSGAGLRRTRATVVSQRPLSRVFLDGTNR